MTEDEVQNGSRSVKSRTELLHTLKRDAVTLGRTNSGTVLNDTFKECETKEDT